MLGDLVSQGMFGYWENEGKYRILLRENKENSIIKSFSKLFNEKFKFLFIGQGCGHFASSKRSFGTFPIQKYEV